MTAACFTSLGKRLVVALVIAAMLLPHIAWAGAYLWQDEPESIPSQGSSFWQDNPQPISSGRARPWADADPGEGDNSENNAWVSGHESETGFPSSSDGGSTLDTGSGSLSTSDLFGGIDADDGPTGAHGSEEEKIRMGEGAHDSLMGGEDEGAQAYQLLMDTSTRNRPDIMNDSSWDSVDAFFGSIYGEELDCDTGGGSSYYTTCHREFEPSFPDGCGYTRELDFTPGEGGGYYYLESEIWPVTNEACLIGDRPYGDYCQRIDECVTYAKESYRVTGVMDIILLVDVSGSMNIAVPGGATRMQVAQDVVNEIGPQLEERGYNVGVIEYSSGTDVRLNLDQSFNNISFSAGGQTNTHLAIQQARDLMFYRESEAKVIIDITDGVATDSSATAEQISWVENQSGWAIGAIGIGLTVPNYYSVRSTISDADAELGLSGALLDLIEATEETLSRDYCLEINGKLICGDFEQHGPAGGLEKNCVETRSSWECNFPGGDLVTAQSCAQVEENPSCGFISSSCLPGGTDSTGRCYAWEERFQCQENPSTSAACAAQDLLGEDFGECDFQLVEEEVTSTVALYETLSCEYAVALTECSAERSLSVSDVVVDETITEEGCFDERTVWFDPQLPDTTGEASVQLVDQGEGVTAKLIESPSAGNDWRVKVRFQGDMSIEEEGGEQVEVCPDPHVGQARIRVDARVVEQEIIDSPAEPENDPCIREDDEMYRADWSCTAQGPVTIDGLTIDGSYVGLLDELFPGSDGGQLCLSAQAQYEPVPLEERDLEFCYDDLDGNEICTQLDDEALALQESEACGELNARVASGECEFIRTEPLEDGEGATGFQYLYQRDYRCVEPGTETTVTETIVTEQYDCQGVRCMGEECVITNREFSEDFEKAVAMLEVLQTIGNDIECSTNAPSSCRVFTGKAQECKRALGGWVDCCDKPSGVSLTDYVQVIKAMNKLDGAIMAADGVPTLQGAWSKIRSPAANAWDATTDLFSSAMDTITGSATEAATEAAAEGLLSRWKEEAIKKTADFVADRFGEEAASMIFEYAGGAATGQLAQGFATALSVIGMIYTIYVIADLVVNIIWSCSDSELQLGADRRLKKTHRLGTYCRKKSPFGCIEKRTSFCVFNAPLPRIIQQQVRPQLGMSWGSRKSPNCEGILVDDLDKIDWTQVDLSEWLDILKISGEMASHKEIDIGRMTGQGSMLDVDGDRLPAQERAAERIGDTNMFEQQTENRKDIWGAQ